jgi:hypothetical protein
MHIHFVAEKSYNKEAQHQCIIKLEKNPATLLAARLQG